MILARRTLPKPTLDHYDLAPLWKSYELIPPPIYFGRSIPHWHQRASSIARPLRGEIIKPTKVVNYWSVRRPPILNGYIKDAMLYAATVGIAVLAIDSLLFQWEPDNKEYVLGIQATEPFCPWCHRPQVQNMPSSTKVRCFCDRLYFTF